ncbi:MAG: hypothetical protein HKN34_07840 [Gammaproteobacteria bacterium]|nr:hypothetical protein [Gammaproteobacteria bacterium]
MKRFNIYFSALVIVCLFVVGCSSKTRVESDLHIEDAPDWVNEGNQMLNDDDGRLFHGIGSAPVVGDYSLQKNTADDRARAEVARVFSSYLTVVSKDYSAAAGQGDEQLNEQAISRQIDNLTQINLTGAKIIARWKDENNGTIWSLAELDLERVRQTLEKAETMSPALREFLSKESNSIFDRLTGVKQ